MREIKFRAWDEKGNKMFNVDVLAISPCTWDCPDYGKRGVSLAYQPSIKVMQYTGLNDKNGTEIYEGDIVKYKFAFYRDISKVEFNQDIAAFDMVSIKELDDNSSMRAFKKGSRRGFNKNLVAGFDYVEVIGNIYENPELLKE